MRLHLGELRERSPGGLIAPGLLGRRRKRVETMYLDVLIGGLVLVDHHLVARLPAGHPVADLPDDPRGVGAADVVPYSGWSP